MFCIYHWMHDGGVPSLLLERASAKDRNCFFSSLYLTVFSFSASSFLFLFSSFIWSFFFLYPLLSSFSAASPRGEDPAVADAPWGLLHTRGCFHCESIYHLVYILRTYIYIHNFDIYPYTYIQDEIDLQQLCWAATSCFLAPSCIPPLELQISSRNTSSSRLVRLHLPVLFRSIGLATLTIRSVIILSYALGFLYIKERRESVCVWRERLLGRSSHKAATTKTTPQPLRTTMDKLSGLSQLLLA